MFCKERADQQVFLNQMVISRNFPFQITNELVFCQLESL